MKNWLEKQFKLSEYHTDVKTELLAGLTTFVTMAYVLATVPNILGGANLDKHVMLTACFMLTGITRTTASLRPRNEIRINRTPLQKITPAATGALIPSLEIMEATIPTLPSPGASANGRLV